MKKYLAVGVVPQFAMSADAKLLGVAQTNKPSSLAAREGVLDIL